MSRILVTGGAGFIGSHVVERFAHDGWDVTAVDDLSGGTRYDDLVRWWHGLGVDFVHQTVDAMAPTPHDVYVHLASPVGPVGVLEAPGRIAWNILNDARLVARLAMRDDATMVFVSTSELYGPQFGPSSEDALPTFVTEPSARQEYAIGKLAAEIALLNTPGLKVRIVRPFNVAGPRQRPGGGFVIPRWIEANRDGEPITVYGSGTQRRAFCHVADFVDGLALVVYGGRDGERYNLGNPENACSLNELAAMFAQLTRAEIVHVDPVELHGPTFREAPDKVPVIDKARRELGFAPFRTNGAILADALDADGWVG